MNILKQHKFFLFYFILLCCLLTDASFIVYAQQNYDNNSSSVIPIKSAVLKYSKINNKDRFTFDFPEGSKVSYDIKSDEKSTTIVFSRVFRFETLNLTNFDKYQQITQRKISARQMEISFPQPLASSVEHLNSVILDLAPQGTISSSEKPKHITPLQISSLSFSWNTPVALAVFKRDKYIWIVFNQYQKMDITELSKNAGHMVKDIIQLPHNAATILRLEATAELYSEVRKEGLLWIIDLYNHQAERKLNPIKVTTDETFPDRPSIVVTLPHTEDVFSFLDPEVGDMLMAITSSEAGHSFINGYKYPDFEFLPTSQGMAINSDDFGIGIIRNTSGFILQTTQHPLNISQNLDILKQRAIRETDNSGVNLTQDLTIPIIRRNFAESEKYFQSQIKLAPEADKNKFKIELARFYLSHGLGSNALGLLRDVRRNLRENKQDMTPRLRSLIGVASFLMKRYDQAFDIFAREEFSQNNEIVFWRTLADTDINQDHTPTIMRDLSLFHPYPIEIKKILLMRALELAVSQKNDNLTQKLIDIIKELPMDTEMRTAINYYEAEKVRMQGYFKSALPLYKAAAMSPSLKYSALARFRIADFNSNLADVKQNRTILEFERLKFAWGEKKFKIQVLNKLVDLYLKTNNFYMALTTLDLISLISAKQKPVIEQRMVQIMEELFYYNNDNQFDPIKALALFDEFGYLINRSPYQTAIIIKLSDRLVALDLLDRAYNLLDSYMQTHLKTLSHQEISAMGSRLALINMFRKDEISALENLKKTDYPDISETLATQRKIIEAKAYVLQGMPQKALDLLKDNTSRNAILLKSEIYWDSQQWDKASDMLRYLVKKPKKGEPLSEEQIRYILDWLTALKQAGKETVIVRVRNTFKPYFDKTSYASIFNLLTDFLENDTISIKDIDRTIQNVQAFSNFAKEYTKSLLKENITEKQNDSQ